MNIKKLTGILITAVLILCFMLTACGHSVTVTSIAITKMPIKTSYYIGDEFSAEGGELTAKLSDSTEEIISLTDEAVEISVVNTDKAGKKTVTVTYGGKRARFEIVVSAQTFAVTFHLNFTGAPEAEVKTVIKGATVFSEEEEAVDPERVDFIFDGWFTDTACTAPFDFTTAVSGNLDLYAAWLNAKIIYYNAKFEHNYYGVKATAIVTLKVEEGGTVTRPTVNPSRTGYNFVNWYEDALCTTLYDFNSTFNADKVIYAGWTKTHSGARTYIFEAEDTDLTGKVGPGFSTEAGGPSMIVEDTALGASNSRFVSYLYRKGLSVDFYIASDADADNVTFTVRLAIEYFKIVNLTPVNYKITVNGETLSYAAIFMTLGDDDKIPFRDFELTTTLSLKKGQNEIKLITNDVLSEAEQIATMTSVAPIVDCIKLTATNAVLIWDGVKNLPKAGNYY